MLKEFIWFELQKVHSRYELKWRRRVLKKEPMRTAKEVEEQ